MRLLLIRHAPTASTRRAGFLDESLDEAATSAAGKLGSSLPAHLKAPIGSFWRIDIAPLSTTELHATADGWRLSCVNRSQGGWCEVGR